MTMRVFKQLAILTLLLFFAHQTGFATNLIVRKRISVSRALAGYVLVRGTDQPATGVTVELCSSDWKTVTASTKTDENGHFSIEHPPMGRLFYIRVSAPRMDIFELRVRPDRHATQELTIHLNVAT